MKNANKQLDGHVNVLDGREKNKFGNKSNTNRSNFSFYLRNALTTASRLKNYRHYILSIFSRHFYQWISSVIDVHFHFSRFCSPCKIQPNQTRNSVCDNHCINRKPIKNTAPIKMMAVVVAYTSWYEEEAPFSIRRLAIQHAWSGPTRFYCIDSGTNAWNIQFGQLI